MTRHMLFLRWWLIVTLIGIGAVFAGRFGVFHEIYDKDITRLSFVIFTGFLFMSSWCGIKTYRLSLLADKGFPGAGLLTENDRVEMERCPTSRRSGGLPPAPSPASAWSAPSSA
jgi:hypothetical protein